MGWPRARAMLARASNGLVEHERVRELGTQILGQLSAEERRCVRTGSLQLAIEVPLAAP